MTHKTVFKYFNDLFKSLFMVLSGDLGLLFRQRHTSLPDSPFVFL